MVNIIVPVCNLGRSFRKVKSRKNWEKVLKKSVNLFQNCIGTLKSVHKLEQVINWKIHLFQIFAFTGISKLSGTNY